MRTQNLVMGIKPMSQELSAIIHNVTQSMDLANFHFAHWKQLARFNGILAVDCTSGSGIESMRLSSINI